MDKYLNFNDAIEKSLKIAKSTKLKEYVDIMSSLNRVLCEPIVCRKNLPSFNNSAMDGFAIRASDAGGKLNIVETIFAGDSIEPCLNEGECYRIMTGAKVPDDADTIIPIEDVESFTKSEVIIKRGVIKGSSLRLKGEELLKGEPLFTTGEAINPGMIAVLASQGITKIPVYKKISIAVASTGNELKEPWDMANEGEVYNSNSYAIVSLLKERGFDATYTGVVPDNLEKSVEFIKELKSYDAVITTGGVSVGDADFVAEAFLQNGLNMAFHGVNIKPGKPIMMGEMGSTLVISLPGNPLSAMVNMHLFAIATLNKIQGNRALYHNIEVAKNINHFKTKKGRVNAILGVVEKGEYRATKESKYGSGMVTVLAQSNSIIVTGESRSLVEADESVKIIKFNCSYLEKKIDIVNWK